MGLAQFIHLSAIVIGISIALWGRWFALVIAAALLLLLSSLVLWLSGTALLTALGSAVIDIVFLQFSYFLSFVVLSFIPEKLRVRLTRQDQSLANRNKFLSII